MAPTKPRFGGGRNMESNAIKTFSSPMDLGRETQNTRHMEASLYIQSCHPQVPEKDEESCRKNKTGENVSGERVTENEQSAVDNFRSSEILSQNHSETLNRDFEKEKCISETFSGHDKKADVNQLMSALQSLGIHVAIKPYIRSASISSLEMDSAAEDGAAQEEISRHYQSIDQNITSFNKKTPDETRSKDDEKQEDNNNFLYCKNLFLKDRQDHYYLIIAEESALVDFKVLKKQLSAARNLSFADATATERILGEKSGGINPFVAMRESASEVRFVLHQSLLEAKNSRTLLAFHPLDSSLQIEITVGELMSFLEYFDKPLEILPADLSSSTLFECKSSKADQGRRATDISKEGKQKKIKMKDMGAGADDSGSLEVKQDNKLLNPTVNGKPLWKVHMRKGKLKSFLKTTNGNTMTDTKASKLDAVGEFKEKETEIAGEASSSNPFITQRQTEKSRFHDADSKIHTQLYECPKETKFDNSKIEQANHCLDSPETVKNSSTLPEITQFYNNLSELCIECQDLEIRTSTTRDIGPSIGCKCFFLKDRRQNYYLIITHEYYELDHGRLKKALKPKKKLDHAEPADILENLGVQPSRITPFSCTTDRAIAKNVTVSITEKIQLPEVILCIQHPFAEGRRLIMKSGELQRYLSTFRSPVGKVEEKPWPEKYSRIFTRFTDQSFKLNLVSEAVLLTSEQQQNVPITDTGNPKLVLESEDQTGFIGEKGRNSNSPNTKQHRASTARNLMSALRKGCEMIGKAFLVHAGIETSLTISSLVQNVDDSSNGQASQGSSVDPAAKGTRKDSALSFEKSLTARSKAERIIVSELTSVEGSETVNNGECDSEFTECNLNIHCHKRCQDIHSDTGDTSLTIEDILRHLRGIAVDFMYTDSSDMSFVGVELDQGLQNYERKRLLVSIETPVKMESDTGDLPRGVIRADNEKKDDDHDNVEICATAYICGNDNSHYIVIGGESDYLTKRRLRRLFQIPGPLRMDDAITPGLTTTPFSLALALKERSHQENLPPKVYAILFTSLYLDPETKCVFHLDQKGSILTLTSSNLENFIRKSGMECWYIP